ncbi:MAG: hypothetical protein HY553_20445 [Elusimicrobia bacterium]|nr:hypothetical protein [Elusimicrobiota bacterium]
MTRREPRPERLLIVLALFCPQANALAQTRFAPVEAPAAFVSVAPIAGALPTLSAAPSLPAPLLSRTVALAPSTPASPALTQSRFWNPGLARALDEAAAFLAPSAAATPAPAGSGLRAAALAAAPGAEGPGESFRAPAAEPRLDPEARIPPAKSGRLRDAWTYSRIVLSSLYWYTGPRLIERWDELAAKLREAGDRPRAVRDIRGFFIAHRVLGSTGSYSPLGFRVASNRIVAKDAVEIYDRYFAKGREAKRAFVRLIQRAQHYNPNRRSTQFRKAIFHALREASVLPPDEVAAFFDKQLGPEKSARLEAYQRDVQGKVLAAFDVAVNEVLSEMNRGLPAGERVVGALLLGSFANGAAGPGSDLDVQAIAEGGSTRFNDEFIKRLKARWAREEEWSGSPVSTFQYVMPASKRLIARVHREPYLIFSPYPEVTAAFTRTPEQEAADAPSTIRTVRGWLFQRYYTMVLYGVLAAHDLGRLSHR